MNARIFSFFGIVLLSLIFFNSVFAQKSKAQLEKERQQALAKINEVQAILEQTSKERKSSVGQLNALNKQLQQRKALINNIKKEINQLNQNIDQNEGVIVSLESDLTNLKAEYAEMAYAAYKASNGYDQLVFLFSAQSFNQFLMRLKYMQQYSQARKDQFRLILQVQDQLMAEKNVLIENKTEKQSLLNQQIEENKKLAGLRKKQENVLASLKKEEASLTKEIQKNQKEIDKLEKLIAELVKKEVDKTELATKNAVAKTEITNLTKSFEGLKTKMVWPVSSGFISEEFGTHPHPVLKRVKIKNDGVNIQTNEGEKVKAVFSGKVKAVAEVPGNMRYVVLVQHGDYFTVYAKLREVYVKKGQVIATGDSIGKVNTDSNGVSELQFQVWRNNQKLNPAEWLASR